MSSISVWFKSQVAAFLFGRLFLLAPEFRLDSAKVRIFEDLFREATDGQASGLISYECEYPKHEFLRYLVENKDVLLHGSNSPDITVLEPKEQTDFGGKLVTAVFAAADGIWPMFFAVLDHANFRGSLRNGCFVVTNHRAAVRRFYFFSISAEMLPRRPWTEGTVYILPQDSFEQTSKGVMRFDEWASREPVYPLARLPVAPDDFPFLRNVTGHDKRESIYLTWLRYRRRQNKP